MFAFVTPRPRRSMAAPVARCSRATGARSSRAAWTYATRLAGLGPLVLAVLLTGCNSALESEPQPQAGAAHAAESADAAGGLKRSRAPRSAGSLTMLSEVVGRGAPVDEATCLALDVDLEVADEHTPVPSPSADGPLIVARDDQRLIVGLRTGIEGMAVDGRRSMLIPPALAYGNAGWGNGLVGPNDTLRADISVLWAGRRPSWTWPDLRRAARAGGGALDLVTGSGAPFSAGATGMVMIDAVDLDAESIEGSMWDGCNARALDLASNDLASWFVDNLEGLRPGGTRLVLQPDHASGDHGVDAWVVTLAMTRD